MSIGRTSWAKTNDSFFLSVGIIIPRHLEPRPKRLKDLLRLMTDLLY
jgi:hypothetical protein